MISETVDLYAYFGAERGTATGGYLTVYARSRNNELEEKVRPAALIVPGGAYAFVSDREGEPVALRFLAEGYAVFLLQYTVHAPYPVPLLEGAMAMAYLRKEAEKYFADPEQVCVVGFSAGGHLAGMLIVLYGDEHVRALLGKDAGLVRPDASVLSYAVLTSDSHTHRGTIKTISGGDEALLSKLSIVDNVTKDCPPVFLWHTATDGAVPVENSLRMAAACRAADVPFELHVFSDGPHGLSLADRETADEKHSRIVPPVQAWFPLAISWLETLGFSVRTRR